MFKIVKALKRAKYKTKINQNKKTPDECRPVQTKRF